MAIVLYTIIGYDGTCVQTFMDPAIHCTDSSIVVKVATKPIQLGVKEGLHMHSADPC